jgi:hypothetical protein
MPTDSELRQMALDIIDTAFLRLIDEICKDVLNEDLSWLRVAPCDDVKT